MDKLIEEVEFTNIGRHKITSRVGIRFGIPVVHNVTGFNDLLWYVEVDGGYPMSEHPLGPVSEHRFKTWLDSHQTRMFVTKTGLDFSPNKLINLSLDGMAKHILGLGDRSDSKTTSEEYREAALEGPIRKWISALNKAVIEAQQWYEDGAALSNEQIEQLIPWEKRMANSHNMDGKEYFLGLWRKLCAGRKVMTAEVPLSASQSSDQP